MKLKHVDASRACSWCGNPWFQSMPNGLFVYPPYTVGAIEEDPQQDHAEGAPGDGAIDHEAQEEPQQEDAEGAPGDGDHAEHQPEQGSAD